MVLMRGIVWKNDCNSVSTQSSLIGPLLRKLITQLLPSILFWKNKLWTVFTELIPPDALLSPATEIEKLLIQILSSTLFLLFYSQYYIVTHSLSLLRCRDGYMSVYPFILCDYSRHSQHVYLYSTSIVGFVVYGVILSCIWIYLIRVNRQGIKNNSSKLNAWYGFFHSDFKARYKWWNLFVLFRRLILACFVGLLANIPSWQGVGISFVLQVNIALVAWLQPAITTADNIAEVVAVAGLLLTHMNLEAGGEKVGQCKDDVFLCECIDNTYVYWFDCV